MKRGMIVAAAALMLGVASGPALAADSTANANQPAAAASSAPAATSQTTGYRDLPAAGLSADDVVNWLQGEGYKATVKTNTDGTKTVSSATDGTNFNIDFYDCHDKPTCTAIQFSVGFDTKGAWNATKMNSYNSSKRWVRAYVDDKDDPWLEQDVDLIPGGTWEGLDDQFAIWRQMLADFEKYINW